MRSRRWWQAAAALLILLLLVCPSAHAQLVCPESAGDMALVHDSGPDAMGRITGQVKDGYGGQKLFHCLYANADRAARNRIGHGTVSVTWVPPEATGPGRGAWRSCAESPRHASSASSGYDGSFSSAARMVTVSYSVFSAVGYDSRETPLRDVAARLLEQADALGAPCSAAAQASPGSPPSPPPEALPERIAEQTPLNVVGFVVGFTGDVVLKRGGARNADGRVGLGTPLASGDVVITGKDSRARVEFAGRNNVFGSGPFVINVGPETELRVAEFIAALDEQEQPKGWFDLVRGYIRWAWGGDDGTFSVRSGATVCGIRGTDVVIAYDPQRDQVAYFLREGRVEISRGSVRQELQAGQMVAVQGGVLQPVRPLELANWERLVAALDVPEAASAFPGANAPRGPATVDPTGPVAATSWSDVTRRDLPVGAMPRGGATRFVGDSYVVQSAEALATSQEIGPEALSEFRAATDVRLGDRTTRGAGLYLSSASNAAGRPGDLFFGLGQRGPVVKYQDERGWHDVPLLQTRGPEPSVRLEIICRSGSRCELRWNDALLAEHLAEPGPKRVMLFVAEGGLAEFRVFTVTAPPAFGGSRR